LLRDNAVGLFVRLKVEQSYCIAQVLDIPVGTVKSRVFTAMRKLNEIWMRMQQDS
jgi:hypothetical protein